MKYKTMFITTDEPGNTNEGISVEFNEMDVRDDPLDYLSDTVDWHVENLIAVGVRMRGEWSIRTALEHEAVLEQRTKDRENEDTEAVLKAFNLETPTTAWNLNDPVAIILGDDVYAIGWIKAIGNSIATVIEANAFHRVWGSSNAERGRQHHIPLISLYRCPTGVKHIVLEVRDKAGAAA